MIRPPVRSVRTRGFTLTEIAIVLLVISVILSSIWVAAGLVREKSRISAAVNQLNLVAQNMTALLQGGYGVANPPCAPPCDITQAMITAGTIPIWAQGSATQGNNPWTNKSFFMEWVNNNPRTYRMSFYSVTRAGCLGLIEQTTGCTPGQPGCPTQIGTGGTAPAPNYAAPPTTQVTTNGVTTTNMQTLCNANNYAGGAANSVEFDFTQ